MARIINTDILLNIIGIMKISSISFPSVFETAFGNTENSSGDLLSGLKVKKDNSWYLVGNLAKKGGINPGRITNASPGEEDPKPLTPISHASYFSTDNN